MGSPAEQRAMQFAISKFREFGCQETYVMPMNAAEGINTKSGIAVGVLKGRTDRIIVIGGHIDSAGPDIPGANDDGSGVACVLELARILCKDQHESTIMFCCWGGEESGLQGSQYFVDHFDKLDSVALMLQIDMADGASILEIDPDYGEISSPRWLTAAVYDVFYNELHSTGLVYPVASATLNAATGGSTGSDHDSFLEKGIPAIDFTSDVDYPIHTPQDNLANFTPSGLKKTGDLVLKLVGRFDGGVPSRSTDRYMLVQLGATPVFLSHWILWTVISLVCVLAVASIVQMKRRRVLVVGGEQVQWSGIKLVFFTLIIQTFVWLADAVFGVVRGYRFPWVNNFGGFVLLGVLSGSLGLWLVLKLARRLPLSADPFVFVWRSLGVLVMLTLLLSLRGPEIALFPGLATLFMTLALLVRSSFVRVTLWMVSCLTMVRLVFFEELGLIQRLISENRIHTLSGLIGNEAIYVVLFTVFSMPFVFGFAGIYRSSGIDLLWLKKFRSNRGVVVATGLLVCVAVYLMLRPVYDARWYNNIIVEQRFDLGADSSKIELKGSEYLNGTMMHAGGWEMKFTEQTNLHDFSPSGPTVVRWASLERRVDSVESVADTVIIQRNVRLHSLLRPFTVSISYRSDTPFTVRSQWSHGGTPRLGRESDNLKIFSWYCFPDTNLVIPVIFRLRQGQKVAERIEITYDSLALDLHLQREFTNMQYRTIVAAVDTFPSSVSGMGKSKGIE